MKHVFSSASETAHAWANGTLHDWGRNGSDNVNFTDGMVCSYSTPMAIRSEPTNYILFNKSNYSSTTKRHQNAILYAIPYCDRDKIIEIDLRGSGRSYYGWGSVDFTPYGITKAFNSEIVITSEKLAKARKKEIYIAKLQHIQNDIKKYLSYLEECEELALTERHECSTVQERNEVMQLIGLLNNIQQIDEQMKEVLKLRKEEEKKEIEGLRVEFETSLKDWKEHKTEHVKHVYKMQEVDKTDYVRISKDGKCFETHRGAKVKIEDGLKLYKILNQFKHMQDFKIVKSEFIGLRIGAFRLDSIKENGDCQVGCHRFKFLELERVYNEFKSL